MRLHTAILARFLTVLALSAAAFGQGQSFNVGQWFFGKTATADLPTGVVDLSDHLFASETYTCALVMIGAKATPQTQIMCRSHLPGSKFLPIIAEGDPRLGANMRLAIPVRATDDAGRYLTSMVRPEKTNLYFTSVVNNISVGFSHQIAWRVRNYTTLERVAGVGDVVTVKLLNGATQSVTLSAAGPVDANAEGREFIYMESAAANLRGIFELQSNGVFNTLFLSPLPMRDTPWGMGGFAFADGGVAFKQQLTLYLLDPNNRCPTGSERPCLTNIAQEGTVFSGNPNRFPNLGLAQMFRPTDDAHTFYFSWGIGNGVANPNEIVTAWKNYAWAPVFDNQPATNQEVTVGSFASGSNSTLMGTGVYSANTQDFDPASRITVKWPIASLWIKTAPAGFTKMLRETQLPDIASGPKKFYQGITSYGCEAEFATKQNDGSFDNSGLFSNFYRLYRPCPATASFNIATGEIIIRGTNLQDQKTEVLVPPAPGSLAPTVNAPVTSATASEVRATAPLGLNVQRVYVVLNSQIISDTIQVNTATAPAPNIADFVDVNFEHSVPSQGKLETICANTSCAQTGNGSFGCQTVGTQTVNYPTSMGNCTVNLETGTPVPLLYTSDSQINLLLPPNLPLGPHTVRVTRADAVGVFSGNTFPFNVSADAPVAIKTGANVIVVVIRNGQVVLIGPNDPIHPGEYFTIYVTGGQLQTFGSTANVGGVDTPIAAAQVVWAQGVTQVNIVAPSTLGVANVKVGLVPVFPIRIN